MRVDLKHGTINANDRKKALLKDTISQSFFLSACQSHDPITQILPMGGGDIFLFYGQSRRLGYNVRRRRSLGGFLL